LEHLLSNGELGRLCQRTTLAVLDQSGAELWHAR